jgi:predicted lipid-binding transport protein (Tim44 family)
MRSTTLVPSAKSFELMTQLEALTHEVAVASRHDSSDQCIKVQDGSNLSAGLQLVEPSIRVSPHDHLASDSPSFGRRRIITLASFFMAARDWLASRRTSAARDWLASYSRPSFGRLSATLASSFIAGRDWLASYRPSFDRRTFPTLASFFIAALIGVAVALVWQSQRVSTANSPNEAAVAEKHSGVTPVGQLSLQDAPPQIASATQTAPASTALATSSELVQQLEAMARDLVVLQRRVEELAGKQEHLAAAQEQLAAKQEQMDQTIAKPQAVKRNTKNKMSSPPRRNASPGPAAQALSLPRPEPNPRPPLSVPPDRR